MLFKKRTKLSQVVEDNEPLARYIFSKEHYSKEKKRVKRQAFLPKQNTVSVIRHKNCPKDCILKIGKKLEKSRVSSLKAWCSIQTQDVRSIDSLDIVSDTSNNQHRRHANIINFPDAKIRQIADDLAELASENKSLVVFNLYDPV
ncbi:MAG: hypothetical protein OXN83_02200 [Oligoflexia bacterium]|nr:hypothetical protein [Oligoflexia bacterium]